MELYQLVSKAARAVQKEEQRPNPLKRIRLVRVIRLGTKTFQSLSNIKFLLELVVGHHRGSTALWFEHWPGDRRVPGSMPSSISCCYYCFLEQETLLSLLQSTQLYKWVNISHRYCKEFGDLLGDLSRRSSTQFRETSLERGLP